MSAALLAGGAGNDSRRPPNAVPIDLRIEDSLRRIALPIRPVSAAMIGVVAGSLAVHLAILAVTVISNRVPLTPPREISVEVVQEVPKPEPPKPEPPKAPEAKKLEPVKAEPPKPPPAPKVEQAKLEPSKPPPVQPAPKKLESPRPTPQPAASKPASPPSEDLAALQRELAALRAQQAALKGESPPPSAGSGALNGSTQALALPSISGDDTGDVVGYQALVFSQLAKAKDIQLDNYRGEAGTTGVRFEIDAAGKLLKAEVAATSGKPALDAQALDIVKHASPFPAPPKDGERTFYANVNFLPPKNR